ncbi:MAG: hypothetical protein DI570_06880 [Phenylobacterium zucineum]|nr:MAG: hypothetical protein DI570_06880 [Phenylobacterium zucineum]
MIEITREIIGAADFELGQVRKAPLRYDITWPAEGEAAGVVLVISGFGDDTSSDYSRKLRGHIVETTGMGAVSVRYHAFEARPNNGGKVVVDPREQVYLLGLAMVHGVKVDMSESALVLADAVGKVDNRSRVRAIIETGSGEPQNFGVIQALDHLCVIGDLIANAPPFDVRRIVALGTSHGGYIAHLMAKFAPSTLAAIIDNSSYAQPPMNFLGIGDESEFTLTAGAAVMDATVRSAWTVSDRQARNYYGRDQDLIRDARYPPHLAAARAAAADHGTQYFMVNSTVDSISPPALKRRQHAALVQAGFDAHLEIIGPEGIDGQLFKMLTHGLGCSLKGLFDRHIGQVRSRTVDPDVMQEAVITYDGVDLVYRFSHTLDAPHVVAETAELFPTVSQVA